MDAHDSCAGPSLRPRRARRGLPSFTKLVRPLRKPGKMGPFSRGKTSLEAINVWRAVSKTARRATASGVQIPPPPPNIVTVTGFLEYFLRPSRYRDVFSQQFLHIRRQEQLSRPFLRGFSRTRPMVRDSGLTARHTRRLPAPHLTGKLPGEPNCHDAYAGTELSVGTACAPRHSGGPPPIRRPVLEKSVTARQGGSEACWRMRMRGLAPFAAGNSGELLTALLGHAPGLTPPNTLLIERTGGNALFLEEGVQTLVETGALVGDGEPRGGLRCCGAALRELDAERLRARPMISHAGGTEGGVGFCSPLTALASRGPIRRSGTAPSACFGPGPGSPEDLRRCRSRSSGDRGLDRRWNLANFE